MTVAGPKGDTEWERTIDYINFGEHLRTAGVWRLQVCLQLLLRAEVGGTCPRRCSSSADLMLPSCIAGGSTIRRTVDCITSSSEQSCWLL